MKRIMGIFLLLCLLLVGCHTVTEQPPTTTPDTTAPTTEPSENTTETTTTQLGLDDEETVKLWLLDKITMYDNGSSQYHYDEHYNVDHCEYMDLENVVRYTTYYEQRDAHGMPCKIRTQWEDGTSDSVTLQYFEDGKPKEKLTDGLNFSGQQYDYDAKGDLSEVREYYDGILDTVIRYEYDGENLSALVCENSVGDKIYDCRIENGLVTERIYYADNESYRYTYEYDQNRNLIKEILYYDGEMMSIDQYFYFEADVPADRAPYISQQQKLLLRV